MNICCEVFFQAYFLMCCEGFECDLHASQPDFGFVIRC